MTDRISDRLAELGIALPEPAAPVAAYVPAVETGGLVYISGQLPFDSGEVMTGRLGEDRDLDYGVRAAERLRGDADRPDEEGPGLARPGRTGREARRLRQRAADFTGQPKVANGASELMEKVFGEAGRHARSAVGVPVLPLGAAVEIDAIVAVKGS
jgi:enamine deaminase RidA (YjgF/YER057c/UK114 family)